MDTFLSATAFTSSFKNPQATYRDMPFWGWNGRLDREQIIRQIGIFETMGMGGFHIHARSGLSTPYLGTEFMQMVKLSISEAKKRGLYAWLYDEDRYPSGYAGGKVTEDPEMIGRSLRISATPLNQPNQQDQIENGTYENEKKLLACYLIRQDDEGKLIDYHLCKPNDPAPDGYRMIYCEKVLNQSSTWFNNSAYFDGLNPKATRRFLQTTHQAYAETSGEDFGVTVPGIFTDEPTHGSYNLPRTATDPDFVAKLPYTDSLPESYKAEYDEDVFATLPEVIFEKTEGYSRARYRYHAHTAKLFELGFSKQIGTWCNEHGLLFSGHFYGEGTLESQTSCTGDMMRHYRYFGVPCIDMLCDSIELNTVKQCQSASRQCGKNRIGSELDGVTDWDFPFFCHKGHGDWQAAMGINFRIPHHALMSLGGEAKRDYPASIGEQSPWFEKYPVVADHFARVNVAMCAGKPCCRIGVIHPVESFWLAYGPKEQTVLAQKQMEDDFQKLTASLLYGLLDFDFIAESLLDEQEPHAENGKLAVGHMEYEAVVVPPCLTLRQSTLNVLTACADNGVRVIFAGDPPALVDAGPNNAVASLAKRCRQIPFSTQALFEELKHCRDLTVINKNSSTPAKSLLYQLRIEDDGSRLLFIANTDRIGTIFPAEIRLRGSWQVHELDTASGTFTPRKAVTKADTTTFSFCFHPHGHLLLRLTPSHESRGEPFPTPSYLSGRTEETIVTRIQGQKIPVTLTESNVLPLDLAEWRFGNEESWRSRDEVLRIDDSVRSALGLAARSGMCAQPWSLPESNNVYGNVSLRFQFESKIALDSVELAGEQLGQWQCILDDNPIFLTLNGYWCDQAIEKASLPFLESGVHTLVMQRRYQMDSVIEPFYLLGDFGVTVAADSTRITEPVKTLSWGDITRQGLPFYGGNLVYHTTFELQEERDVTLRVPSRMTGGGVPTEIRDNHATREIDFAGFRGTIASITLDGQQKGDIAFAPFELPLGQMQQGRHKLTITLYTSRRNCLGALHQAFRTTVAGPSIWRTKGDEFCYDYRIFANGILVSPLLVQES